MAKTARDKKVALFIQGARRLPPPDREKPTSYGREGNSVTTGYYNDPSYKPKRGYKDAPGGKIFSGQLSYNLRKGRRKI